MSVNIAHYVIAGVILPADGVEYSKVEKYEISYWKKPKRGTFGVLYDGMSGEYTIAGRVMVATSYDEDYFGDSNTRPIDLTIPEYEIASIKKELKTKLNIYAKEIKLIAITHHT